MFATWVAADSRFSFSLDTGSIRISAAAHAALMSEQQAGRVIVPGPDGLPTAVIPVAAAMSLEQVRQARLAAYSSESDPLKMEAEHDAILAGVAPDYSAWLSKVAEIKARYPLPE